MASVSDCGARVRDPVGAGTRRCHPEHNAVMAAIPAVPATAMTTLAGLAGAPWRGSSSQPHYWAG
jgi:hypothetical protein